MKVHLTGDWTDAQRATLPPATSGDTPPPDTQCLVTGGATAEELRALPDLRAVVVPWAGPGEKLRAACREAGVSLHNLHDNAEATAEHAVMLLLAAARRVTLMDAELRAGRWGGRTEGAPDHLPDVMVLHGRRAVVLGAGAIGRHVAGVLAALGMKVTPVTRTGRGGTTPVADLPAALDGADVLVVACPLTDDTRGLVDAAALARLAKRSIVVNVGRGPVIDEAALHDALTAGHVAAAGLDVWWDYNTLGGRDWASLPQVVMTPHVGGAHSAAGQRDRRAAALADLLDALARGESPNRVDLAAGY